MLCLARPKSNALTTPIQVNKFFFTILIARASNLQNLKLSFFKLILKRSQLKEVYHSRKAKLQVESGIRNQKTSDFSHYFVFDLSFRNFRQGQVFCQIIFSCYDFTIFSRTLVELEHFKTK